MKSASPVNSELQPAPIFDQYVCALGPCARADDGFATQALPKKPAARDVVRMRVRVQGVHELQAELVEELDVALELIDYWVDQHRLAGCLVGDEVGVRPGLVIEELPK
jgi:hypothetical protein